MGSEMCIRDRSSNIRDVEVCPSEELLASCKQVMEQVLGTDIKDEAARCAHEGVTPPLAVAPLAHGDDMRWNPNDDGINFNP